MATAALVLAGLHLLATAVAGTVAWMPLGLTVATAAVAAGWRWLPAGCRQDLAGVLGVLWLVAAPQATCTAVVLAWGGLLAVGAAGCCLLAALRD